MPAKRSKSASPKRKKSSKSMSKSMKRTKLTLAMRGVGALITRTDKKTGEKYKVRVYQRASGAFYTMRVQHRKGSKQYKMYSPKKR